MRSRFLPTFPDGSSPAEPTIADYERAARYWHNTAEQLADRFLHVDARAARYRAEAFERTIVQIQWSRGIGQATRQR